ncbi:hypothetical protein FHS18_003947 [Paenibacillus phyllosphaerae]|uniref:Uncharacterized protein n=1 Tax=Paenibacillus phyllosphaerae TaxID=274593 RepID=A0A7W5B0J0_9BACL|nr:hypothetical protein [Paenibacillus phyllosphaerae]MBB3111879.1 hypothetical protein [Paenibacillus phyllosphaerae]
MFNTTAARLASLFGLAAFVLTFVGYILFQREMRSMGEEFDDLTPFLFPAAILSLSFAASRILLLGVLALLFSLPSLIFLAGGFPIAGLVPLCNLFAILMAIAQTDDHQPSH